MLNSKDYRNFGRLHELVLPDLFPVVLWFNGASLPLGSPPVRSPTAPPTPPPPPAANFAWATGMGPGFVMVVIVAAGIISVDMANIGTPDGGDLAPSVTGRYGNRLAGIQLHSSSRGEFVCPFFVFVRRWFSFISIRDYVFNSKDCRNLCRPLNFTFTKDYGLSPKAFLFTSLVEVLPDSTASTRKVFRPRLDFASNRNFLHLSEVFNVLSLSLFSTRDNVVSSESV